MHKNFRTYQIAVQFYQKASTLKLRNPLKDQYDRALLSIVLNLSEGSAKPTAKDRRKFYYIAFASLREVQTLLQITDNRSLLTDSDILAAHLYKLTRNT